MGNPFCHMELMSIDTKKAKDFFVQMFDWQFDPIKGGDGLDYTVIRVGDGTGGGIMKNPMPAAPSMWIPYVLVDDLKAATDKAVKLGATLIKDITEVPNVGWLTIIVEPSGSMMGLWKPKAE